MIDNTRTASSNHSERFYLGGDAGKYLKVVEDPGFLRGPSANRKGWRGDQENYLAKIFWKPCENDRKLGGGGAPKNCLCRSVTLMPVLPNLVSFGKTRVMFVPQSYALHGNTRVGQTEPADRSPGANPARQDVVWVQVPVLYLGVKINTILFRKKNVRQVLQR